MAQLYLLRHGESMANLRPDLIGGRTNETALSALGEEQAKAVGRYIQRLLIQPLVAVSSPAVRTRRTLRLALREANSALPIYLTDDLQELSQGAAEGQPRSDVYTNEVMAALRASGKDFKLPGGESMNEVGSRMYGAMLAIDHLTLQAERQRDHETPLHGVYLPPAALVSTHETAIKSLVARIKDLPQSWVYQTRLANASITRLTVLDSHIMVDYLGRDVQHG
jgi:broad specificity phosphatase PhoE